MPLLMHVNEVSVSPVGSREASDEVASIFAAAVLAVRRRRGDAVLVAGVPLSKIAFHEHHTLGEWGSEAGNRDRWRLIRLLQSRSPGWHRDRDDADCEYKVGEMTLSALGDAHMSDGLLVSFSTNSGWGDPWIDAQRSYLAQTASGDVQLMSENVEVRHISAEPHLDTHLNWLSLIGLDDVESGVDLQSKCAEMFTSLNFLARASDQLQRLDPKWVAPVTQGLALMNRALVEWKPDASHPSWYTKVSAESQSRREEGLLDFEDLDGVVRTFDTHARFTPGAGRIHFRLDADNRTATVAHIGPKIV